MRYHPNPPRSATCVTRNRRSAFTIVEVLLSLMICGLILGAVAVATKATCDSYKSIQQQGSMALSGQVAMQRLTTLLRSCQVNSKDSSNVLTAQPYDQLAKFQGGTPVDTTGFKVFYQGVLYTCNYNGTNHTVDCQRGTSAAVPLVRNVSGFTAHLVPTTSAETTSTSCDAILVASITLTLDPGAATGTATNPMIFTATVFPRVANYQQTSLNGHID